MGCGSLLDTLPGSFIIKSSPTSRFLGNFNIHSLTSIHQNASYNLDIVLGNPTPKRKSQAHFIMEFAHADETFFIESDEPHRQCIDARTAAKMIARQRQDVIAGELSRLAADEYLEDILKHMQTMEACFPYLVVSSVHC